MLDSFKSLDTFLDTFLQDIFLSPYIDWYDELIWQLHTGDTIVLYACDCGDSYTNLSTKL